MVKHWRQGIVSHKEETACVKAQECEGARRGGGRVGETQQEKSRLKTVTSESFAAKAGRVQPGVI